MNDGISRLFPLFFVQIIEPLPRVDHSTINYENFEKNFYQEHEDIAKLEAVQVDELRKTLGIKASFGWH